MAVRWTARAADRARRSELSAKLTEGLSYRSIDVFTDSSKIMMNRVIGNTDNGQPVFFQKRSSHSIFYHILFFVMLRAIQLNDKFCFCAIEICNEVSQNFLPLETERAQL